MRTRTNRQAITRKGWIGLIMLVLACLPGCPPAGDGSGNENTPIELSADELPIGEFLIISHPSIKAGEMRKVSMRQFNGDVQEFEITPYTDGELSLPTPPTFDPDFSRIRAGALTVSLDGVEGDSLLLNDDLVELPILETGTVMRVFIESSIADGQSLLQKLDGGLDDFSTEAERSTLREQVNANEAFLQGLLDEWDENQTMTFQFSETEDVVLDRSDVLTAERYLVSNLLGLHAELQRRGELQTSRVIGNNCDGRLQDLSGPEIRACIEGYIEDVKAVAIRFSQTGGALSATVGAAITLVGLAASSQVVIATGAVVAAISVIHGFVTALAANENTDTYGQNDGEGFSASREILSQLTRFGANLLSPVVSLALGAKDFSSGLEAAKCDRGDPRQRVIISDDLIEFCQVVFDEDASPGPGTGGSGDPECSLDSDCGVDEVCENGACVANNEPECITDVDCASDEICADGKCVRVTCDELGCPPGEACIDGECGPCEVDTDCPDGQLCIVDECLEGTDVGEGCEVTPCEDGQVCCQSECIPFGHATQGVCPATFEMDFGVFSPSIKEMSLVDFELNAEFFNANCTYSRSDGTPGTFGLTLFYEPIGLNPPSAGLCGEQDDDGDGIIRDNGWHSNSHTLTVVTVFSGSVRMIDADAVLGGMIESAASAGVGSECCPDE